MSKAALTEKQIKKRNYDREAKRTERAEKKAAGLVLFAGHWMEAGERDILRVKIAGWIEEIKQ